MTDHSDVAAPVGGCYVGTGRGARTLPEGDTYAVRYRGAPGHPLIFGASLFPTLSGLRGDKALWELLQGLSEAVRWVDIDQAPPPDINTLEDYRRLRKLPGPHRARSTTKEKGR